jgi:hypothetical protein
VILAQFLGVPHRPGGVYETCTRWWASWLLKAAGVRLVVHGSEHVTGKTSRVFRTLAALVFLHGFEADELLFHCPEDSRTAERVKLAGLPRLTPLLNA